jgi:hypothetical protein
MVHRSLLPHPAAAETRRPIQRLPFKRKIATFGSKEAITRQ